MSLKGGYKILNLKNNPSYDEITKILDTEKVILVSGLVVDDVEQKDCFASVEENEGVYTLKTPDKIITIDEDNGVVVSTGIKVLFKECETDITYNVTHTETNKNLNITTDLGDDYESCIFKMVINTGSGPNTNTYSGIFNKNLSVDSGSMYGGESINASNLNIYVSGKTSINVSTTSGSVSADFDVKKITLYKLQGE